MAEQPAGHRKPKPGRRNVLRKAADSDIHPAEPRTGGGGSSSRGSSSPARSSGASGRGSAGRTARD